MTNNEAPKPATLDDVVAALNRNSDLLEESLIWLKIGGNEKVKSLLISILDTPEKKLVYQLSDGKTSREIASTSGVNQSTVSRYWQSWKKRGIMKTQKVRGGGERHLKAFDLEDFDIAVKSATNTTTTQQTQATGQATLTLDVPVQAQGGDGK